VFLCSCHSTLVLTFRLDLHADEVLSASRRAHMGLWGNLLATISKQASRIGGALQIPALQLSTAADMAEKRNSLAAPR
jgi:hypothetical protein